MPPEKASRIFFVFLEIKYPRKCCGSFSISFAHRSAATVQTAVVTPVAGQS
jgi:hypothetical protein